MISLEVTDVKNLLEILRQYPDAQVQRKIGPGDCWGVKFEPKK